MNDEEIQELNFDEDADDPTTILDHEEKEKMIKDFEQKLGLSREEAEYYASIYARASTDDIASFDVS